jgi:hypothetical protein
MGFATNFCRNMSKRSYQYMVRNTYPLLESNKPRRSPKETVSPRDKNGNVYCGQTSCMFKGKQYIIAGVSGKMVEFIDGTRHRISSVEFPY